MNKMTRQEAVEAIREKLIGMTSDEHSICEVAAEKGIYCHGFRRFNDEDLRERYQWIVRRNPGMGREELEDLANRWQIARQIVNKVPIACDTQMMERDSCAGWDEFDNATIARYYRELLGDDIEITD